MINFLYKRYFIFLPIYWSNLNQSYGFHSFIHISFENYFTDLTKTILINRMVFILISFRNSNLVLYLY